MSQKETNTILSIKDWKRLVLDSFRAFPMIWWRVGTVTLLVFLMAGLGALIFGVLEYVLLGGVENVQNVMANIKMGGNLTIFESCVVWGVFLFGGIWMVLAIALGKIGNLIVLKDYLDNVKQFEANPFKIYFSRGWAFVLRYVTLFLRMVWYAGWGPLLVSVIYAGLISFFAGESFLSVFGLLIFWLLLFISGNGSTTIELSSEFHRLITFLPDYLNIGFVVLGFFVFAFTVYRGFKTAFVQQSLIHFDNQSIRKTFDTALKMVDKSWWKIVLSIFAYFLLINIVRVFFLVPEVLMNYEIIEVKESLLSLAQGVDLLFSLFVLMPLMISFMYMLMLYFAKIKNVKL